jgi:hypothetical protein
LELFGEVSAQLVSRAIKGALEHRVATVGRDVDIDADAGRIQAGKMPSDPARVSLVEARNAFLADPDCKFRVRGAEAPAVAK